MDNIKLGDLINVKHGWPFKGEYFTDHGCQIVLTPANFYESGGFKETPGKEKYYSAAYPCEYLCRQGDLIVAMTQQAEGLLGATARVPSDGIYLHNQRIGLITAKREDVDLTYIDYLMRTPWVRQQIEGSSSGTKVKHTSPEKILDVDVSIPSFEIQQQIGSLLSSIDAKITNNKRIMAELEKTARRIYDYWFTQFDHPNKNGKPYRSSGGKMVWSEELKREIPDSWEVCTIGDLVSFDRGFSYSSANLCGDEGMPMISLASIDRQHRYRPEELKHINVVPDDGECVLPGEMLVACTDLTRLAEIVGCPILAPKTHERFAFSMDLAKLHFNTERVRKYYLYMTMRTDTYHNHIKQFASGTNVLHLDLAGFSWYKIPLPPIGLQGEFDSLLEPILELTDEALRENLDLIELRNWLLPMLMNGQLDVG